MRFLLDTHALLWFLSADARLGPKTAAAISDLENDVFVSIASLWEITVKNRIGKLEADVEAVTSAVAASGLTLLDLKPAHLVAHKRLPIFVEHRDPFDHLLIAQSQSESLTFVSNDKHAPRYGIDLIRCS
ncbi:MAG TPA: type II toxin-antitoxin system VapC family toxin [Aliidongia sp.]|uniref:type II toxin-antitoxin system VapC family toxin n=1 Tax=Aliidongia sp. TaxID=1914230 RepID=UPI002DDCA4BB|nr:type II toxin-antitoxin system VapC family toxin [Aliidongia sp.]HEV2676928.1 type II toxin-antitoxin system VapC family toxin [Aliidongia sp.]